MWPLTFLKWYLFKQSNQNNTDAMKTYNTLDKLCNDVSYASLSWLLTILKRFSDTAFSNREYGPLHPMLSCETDQIYSRADCEKSNNQIFSSLVSNKFSWISASFKLWYMIVSLLVMELFKKKDRPVSNNHPVQYRRPRDRRWTDRYNTHLSSSDILRNLHTYGEGRPYR